MFKVLELTMSFKESSSFNKSQTYPDTSLEVVDLTWFVFKIIFIISHLIKGCIVNAFAHL